MHLSRSDDVGGLGEYPVCHSKTDVTPAILTRVFDARLWRASKSHRREQRSIPAKTSRATVRRAMTQRATRLVTLATLTRDSLSRVRVARLCRRCDIGLRLRSLFSVFPILVPLSRAQVAPLDRFWRSVRHMTFFHARMCCLEFRWYASLFKGQNPSENHKRGRE